MKRITLLVLWFCCGVGLQGQNLLFKQTNKILEYNYGVVDTAYMNRLTASEKIKYELKFVERTYTKRINNSYESDFEIVIDSNQYEEQWMGLAKRFYYGVSKIELFDATNTLLKTIPYSIEQLAKNSEQRIFIQENGYHPGIISIPDYTKEQISKLGTENGTWTRLENGDLKFVQGLNSITYNKSKRTIVHEYLDMDGHKVKETEGFEPYLDGKGYLLKVNKRECFIVTDGGVCVTETKLSYYTNYEIEDNGKLLETSLQKKRTIQLYPNPNDGVFTVSVDLPENVAITSVKVIHVMTGNTISIDSGGNKIFQVSLPNLASGNYVLQVQTSEQKTINTNFFKN
ncbi:MAG: hypothetical protein CFE21_09750 [Bacteroidetes bacterium B1(2017)]|nr:MAG: hypothetical protein CFE21_09750 [Bacteroidetes bacterium B1(2017)]